MKHEQERAQLICRMLMGGNASARAQAVEAVERACEAEAELQAAQEREKELREALEHLIEDVDEAMAEDLRLNALQQKIGALYLGYGGGWNHDDDIREALAAQRAEEPSE